MTKKSKIIVFILLFSMLLSSLISSNIMNVAADAGGGPPYMEWGNPPASPNDKVYWDFNNDTYVGWQMTSDYGSETLMYNITSMGYFTANPPDIDFNFYSVVLQEIYYDMIAKEIKAFNTPFNASIVNFTDPQAGVIYPGVMNEYLDMVANPFIPKNDSDGKSLTIDWSANALRFFYGIMLSNWTYFSCDFKVSGNTIELYNSTKGTYANLTYDDNGILTKAYLNVYWGDPTQRATPVSINYTRIYDFQKDWDLTLGDKVGWHVSHDFGGGGDIFMIYNITDFGYFFNGSGQESYAYGVTLTPMIWNVSLSALQIANLSNNPILNVSLLNVTQTMLTPSFRDDNGGGGFGLMANPFIPITSPGVIDTSWSANAMNREYAIWVSNFTQNIVNVQVLGNSILYTNDTGDFYANLTYDNNGILTFGELKADLHQGGVNTITYNRIYDFDPLNEIVWSDAFDQVGDSVEMYTNDSLIRFDFLNTTDSMYIDLVWKDGQYDEDIFYYQKVWANFSFYSEQSDQWNFIGPTPVSTANEYSPLALFGGDDDDEDSALVLPALLVPVGTTGEDLAMAWKPMILSGYMDFDSLSNGSNWVRFNDSSNGEYAIFKYFADGMLQYLYSTNATSILMDPDGFSTFMRPKNYQTNMTDLAKDTDYDFSFQPTGASYFNVSVHINMTEDAKLIFTSFSKQPLQTAIPNGLFYIDLWFNRTDADDILGEPLNISIEYPGSNTYTYKIYYYNETTDAWELVDFVRVGNTFEISLDHASLFAFVAIPPSVPPSGGDDDDDDDKETVVIPLGNYYLVFLAVGVISLVYYYKKRKI